MIARIERFRWGLVMWLVLALAGMAHGQQLTARDYFLLGSAKLKCRACERAVIDFNKALEMDKNYHEAYYGRSLSFLCMKDYTSASVDIEKALRIKPTQALYLECKARIKLEMGKPQDARQAFQAALNVDSLCWQAWYGRGLSEQKMDSLRLARLSFERTIRLNPDFPMGYLGRGEVLVQQAKYDSALSALNMAANLAPGYARTFQLRSLVYLRLQDKEAALKDAIEAIALAPEEGASYFARAEAYYSAEDFAKADYDYAQAIKWDKSNSQAYLQRGRCAEHMGDLKAAKKQYSKSVSKNKKGVDALTSRASVLERLEKPKKALPDLDKALAVQPNNVELHIRRGHLRIRLGMFQLASDDFVVATRLAPTNGAGFHGLGLARYSLSNLQGACDAWKKGASLGDGKCSEELANYCND